MLLAVDPPATGPQLDWLHVVLGALVLIVPPLAQRFGQWLATQGKVALENQLKAKKLDALLPAVDALVSGVQKEANPATVKAILEHAAQAGVAGHDVIAKATGAAFTPPVATPPSA